MVKLARLSVLASALLATCSISMAAPLAGTTTFEPPVEITPKDVPHDFGKHAVTRLVDWDADGDDDVLIGAGDGRVWLMRNQGHRQFDRLEAVTLSGQPLRLGTQSTTACLIDVNGDKKPDLVVAHSDVHVVVLENRGSAKQPVFADPKPLEGPDGKPLTLPKGCGGRMDARDWDGDGDVDLVAGAFTGPITGFQNVGSAKLPKFAEGIALKIGGSEKGYAYNVHPALFDVNQDGRVDVAYGMNWGTIGFLMNSAEVATPRKESSSVPQLVIEVAPVLSTGKSIDLRAIAGDDATPAFGDLDGDGTLDIVSGGRNGKIFFLRGMPTSKLLDRMTTIMREHPQDLGAALKQDDALRTELIGLHHGMYRLCQGFLNTPAARKTVRDWYIQHIAENSQWLRHGKHDDKAQPYVPSLAYQTWTLLLLLHDGDPDAAAHRQFVAETIGFQGRLKDILVEFGTLIIENGRATQNQQETLYSYLSQIPKPLLGDRSVKAITEVITIGEYLGPRLDVLHAGGVNIFASESGKPKSMENPFPKDFKPQDNDYFGVVLAHELNHRVDATRFAAIPKYNQKYWHHMQKIAGADVKFKGPTGIGVDWDATKKHFAATKLWDGDEKNWNKFWADYWLTGPGKSQTFNVCRNETTYTPPRFGIPFFLETRQESIASLANQYFTDSEHMLQFALDRFKHGSPGCLDEWLLMADVYSMDQPNTFLYRHENGSVYLTHTEATLSRNPQGHIKSITIDTKTYTFELDANGLVENVAVSG